MNVSNNSEFEPEFSATHLPKYLSYHLWLWVIICSTVCLLGAFNNGLVVLAMWRFPELRSAMKILLLNLALTCLLYDVLTGPLMLFSILARLYRDLPHYWCWHFGVFKTCTTFNAVFAVCSISINRLLAVVFPRHYRRMRPYKTVLIFALPCWIIPIVLALGALTLGSHKPLPPFGYCVPDRPYMNSMIQYSFIHIPTAVMSICYCGIVMKLFFLERRVTPWHSSGGSRSASISGPTKLLVKQRARASRCIFPCVLTFFLTNYPTAIQVAVYPDSVRLYPILFLWLRCLFFAVTLFNPIFYAWTDASFRLAFMRILKGNSRCSALPVANDDTVSGRKTSSQAAHPPSSPQGHLPNFNPTAFNVLPVTSFPEPEKQHRRSMGSCTSPSIKQINVWLI